MDDVIDIWRDIPCCFSETCRDMPLGIAAAWSVLTSLGGASPATQWR
jgi:hypothetical protein